MIQNKSMSSTTFQPMQDFILVNPVALEKGEVISESGIIMAKDQNTSIIDRPSTGTVLSVGHDTKFVKEGSTILWVDTDGLDIALSDGEFIILREKSILGYEKWLLITE